MTAADLTARTLRRAAYGEEQPQPAEAATDADDLRARQIVVERIERIDREHEDMCSSVEAAGLWWLVLLGAVGAFLIHCTGVLS